MKSLLAGTLAFGLIVGAIALSGGEQTQKSDGKVQVEVGDKNPWTNLQFNDSPDTFHFAVVSDRTGGHRDRVFSETIDRINLMQPAFVMSVGDLIEGYSKDQKKLTGEWQEFQGYVKRLSMPFFYVPGNHDVANPVEAKEWQVHYGRSYYHFVYKNVLFLAVNSDDPSEDKGDGKISKEQIESIQKALKDNPKVSWTMVFVHKPLWTSTKLESTGWLDVEKALADRPYTVFAGHIHTYQKFIRQGRNYYQLATTGGGSKMRGVPYGEFDHFVWVTMKKDGPVLANILVDGVLPENLSPPISDEKGVPTKNRKEVFAARGKIHFQGKPVPNARVTLFTVPDDPKKKPARVADALVEADGTFAFSTYKAFDGAPVGVYTATVTWNVPRLDENTGKPGPNRLPERYSKADTSGLRVEVRARYPNVFNLNLLP